MASFVERPLPLHEQTSAGELTRSWPGPLDERALFGLPGDVVGALAPQTEADPAALLINLLTAFGNAAGPNAFYLIGADKHYPRIYAVLVGVTAKSRKGSSWGYVKKLMTSSDPDWKLCIAEGLSSGEGLMYALRDKVVTCDPQSGKEQVSDPGVSDKRLMVIESEFCSPLKKMNGPTNTLSPVIRSAWDTGDMRTLTKNCPTRATGAHISIIGHVTKNELTRHLNETESANGFGNRILWICVERSKILSNGGKPEEIDFDGLQAKLSDALRFAKKGGRWILDEDAEAMWEGVYPALSEGLPGMLGAVTSRAEVQVLRLALIYALMDQSPIIKVDHLSAALAVWDYALASARYIFGNATGNRIADEILAALIAKLEGMSKTDIRDLFGKNKKAAEIDRALNLLFQADLVWSESKPTDGRPETRYFYGGHTTITTKTTKGSEAAGICR